MRMRESEREVGVALGNGEVAAAGCAAGSWVVEGRQETAGQISAVKNHRLCRIHLTNPQKNVNSRYFVSSLLSLASCGSTDETN